MARKFSVAALLLPLISSSSGMIDEVQVPLVYDEGACPDYAQYSIYNHRPFSKGSRSLPFQRPHKRCRTFHSDGIERVIEEVTERIVDPDLARLFENTFPSTTDTTVKFHTNGTSPKLKAKKKRLDPDAYFSLDDDDDEEEEKWQGPQSFIITGDIIAEWLRDSTNQLAPYLPLAKKDRAVFDLILGAVNTQSEYVIESPYCNAFHPPPTAGLDISANGQDDNVHPIYDPGFVFECKYELDSLAHFLTLANEFHEHTGSTAFVTDRWLRAVETVLRVLEEQSQPTFDDQTGRYLHNVYTFQRNTNTGTETLNLRGIGNPLANGTGLVRSAFRPSDDATILGFFIPANAMISVQLKKLAPILRKADREDLAALTADWGMTIAKGVWEHGVVDHKKFGRVFAYEVDGFGSSILMDDANYPSLLALPLMGFVEEDDETYQRTRKMILSKEGNPYYLKGRAFHGIGGPHIGLQNAWPMSLLIQAQTSDDDNEIMECLDTVLNSAKHGLIHESIDVNLIYSFTRSWFAWANGVFAATILDLAKRKPHLIFKDKTPYEI